MAVGAADEAALWTLSQGTCYAPRCATPVLVPVAGGKRYRKNVQVAHIYSDKRHGPRYDESKLVIRDQFAHVLLLCIPHHDEVDAPTTWRLYPPELLYEWKRKREGNDGRVLASALGRVTDDLIADRLAKVWEAPLTRLEHVTDRLERIGGDAADVAAQLRRVTTVLRHGQLLNPDTVDIFYSAVTTLSRLGIGPDEVGLLSSAASKLSNCISYETATTLHSAAEMLQLNHHDVTSLESVADRLEVLAKSIPGPNAYRDAEAEIRQSSTQTPEDEPESGEPETNARDVLAGVALVGAVLVFVVGFIAGCAVFGPDQEQIDACTGPKPWKSPGNIELDVDGTPSPSPASCETWHLPSPTKR